MRGAARAREIFDSLELPELTYGHANFCIPLPRRWRRALARMLSPFRETCVMQCNARIVLIQGAVLICTMCVARERERESGYLGTGREGAWGAGAVS